MFDQPDLKANMKLRIITHRNWNAVSNSPEESFPLDTEQGRDKATDVMWMVPFFEEAEGTLQVYVFKETPKISTYLFALAAGNYLVC